MNVTFFMEQHIGHRTYYENLRKGIETLPGINPNWVEVTYEEGDELYRGLSLLPAFLRGPLIGRRQVSTGLRRFVSDIAFFNTQVPAVLAGNAIQVPYVLATDITPLQYDTMADAYGHVTDKVSLVASYKHHANVRLIRGASLILPWSHWAAGSLVDDYGADPARIVVIPPGVDLAFWQPGPIRHSDGPLRILFVGGDFERKGGPLLLEAFRSLPADSAELFLVTRSEVAPEPGVHVFRDLKPNTLQLLTLFQSSDVFVLPTYAEAFGIAAVEASAVGMPVVATNVGGLADIVLDGETGYLIAPGDKTELADRLQRLLDDPRLREQLGRAARLHAESHFDASRNARRVAEVLSSTLEETTTL